MSEIVVGLDDSPSGAAALRWAADEARRRRVVLRAVHALSWPFGAGPDHSLTPASGLDMDEVNAVYHASITRIFDAVGPQPDWILQFAHGDAGPVLVRQSRNALALVLGAPNHVGLGRLLAGSVAHHCLSHAECPVITVPASGRTEPAASAVQASGVQASGQEERESTPGDRSAVPAETRSGR